MMHLKHIDRPHVKSSDFRLAMRRLAGAVCVISTRSDAGAHGLTATAVCSVSADPPTVLVVVNNAARTHGLIGNSRTFVVNILRETQEAVAEIFASNSNEPFVAVPHHVVDDIFPVVDGAIASLLCELADCIQSGTHSIFLGRVCGTITDEGSPLLYFNASYRRISA